VVSCDGQPDREMESPLSVLTCFREARYEHTRDAERAAMLFRALRLRLHPVVDNRKPPPAEASGGASTSMRGRPTKEPHAHQRGPARRCRIGPTRAEPRWSAPSGRLSTCSSTKLRPVPRAGNRKPPTTEAAGGPLHTTPHHRIRVPETRFLKKVPKKGTRLAPSAPSPTPTRRDGNCRHGWTRKAEPDLAGYLNDNAR
jgi:hypothetical protein